MKPRWGRLLAFLAVVILLLWVARPLPAGWPLVEVVFVAFWGGAVVSEVVRGA